MSRVIGHDFYAGKYTGVFGSLGYRIRDLVDGKSTEFPLGFIKGAERFFGIGHSFLVLERGFWPIKGVSDNNTDSLEALQCYDFILESYSESVRRIELGDFNGADGLFREIIGRNISLRGLKDISKGERERFKELGDFYICLSEKGDEDRNRRRYYEDFDDE